MKLRSGNTGDVIDPVNNSVGDEDFVVGTLTVDMCSLLKSNLQGLLAHRGADSILQEILDHEIVQNLDPFGFDVFFSDFVVSNGTTEIPYDYISSVLSTKPFSSFSYHDALAGVRDLGMIAAILTKRRQSLSAIHGLEETLLALAEMTHEVPRDTVYSYAPRNPVGERRRKFTNSEEEDLFIDSVEKGMLGLYGTVANLVSICEGGETTGNTIALLQKSSNWFRLMIEGIVASRKKVTPQFFTDQMRPYFDPIEIGGTLYDGPGGAQMPMIIIDLLLWGSDCNDRRYNLFLEKNLQYCPPALRNIGHAYLGKSSILTLREKNVENIDGFAMSNMLEHVHAMLTQIISFRMPHLAIARANFALRGTEETGSGGYDPTILEHLIELTQAARHKADTLKQQYKS